MRKKLLLTTSLLFALVFIQVSKAQTATDGTLTFTYTQTAPTTLATKNVMAVWIEDNAGNFVKTKMKYVGSGTSDHLPSWTAKSGGNVTDAVTGSTRKPSGAAPATPSAFGVKSFTWNGKGAVSGTTVLDGTYKVMIESSYCNPQPANGQHWLLTSFTFNKSATAEHLTPTGDANFSAIDINWVPTISTSVEPIAENSEINVFPNPTNGIINITYKYATNIKVVNELGATVFEEKVVKNNSNKKSIDLSKMENGIYFVTVIDGEKESKYKVILNK